MNPSVSIIILNWNGWKDTLECLESLYQIDYPNYQVILVDNHSEDSSLEKIRQYCQGQINVESKFFKYIKENKPIKLEEITSQETGNIKEQAENIKEKSITRETGENNLTSIKNTLTLIKNDKNYGFAQGNNIAIKYAQKMHNPQYILLLNNDTVVKPDFLTQMINTAEAVEKTGIVGAKLLNAFHPEIIDSTGHVISWGRIVDRGHGEIDHRQYDNDLEVMGVMAACALYKCEMLKAVGLLDTSYVTLGEDADLSWRAHSQGWKAIYTPKAVVYHKRGQTITRKSVLPEMTLLSLKNTVKYVTRYGNRRNKISFLFLMTKEGLFVLVGSFLGKNETNKSEYFNLLLKSYRKILKSI